MLLDQSSPGRKPFISHRGLPGPLDKARGTDRRSDYSFSVPIQIMLLCIHNNESAWAQGTPDRLEQERGTEGFLRVSWRKHKASVNGSIFIVL